MSDILSQGEFSLTDKLQPEEYLQGRMQALQRLHKLDPRLASEVISYGWPNPAGRAWTDQELYERLGTSRGRRATGYKNAEVSDVYRAVVLRADGGVGDSSMAQAKVGGLLGAGLSAAIGHFGSNALAIKAHHGSNIAEVMSHKGFQHGMLDQQIHPFRQKAISWLMGPEALMNYQAAHLAGRNAVKGQLAEPEARRRALTAFTAHKIDAPLLKPVQQAMQHELAQTEPVLTHEGGAGGLYARILNRMARPTQTGFETGAQKVVSGVQAGFPAAAALAVSTHDPGLLAHMGWNATRGAIGAHPMGLKMVADSAEAGLRGEMYSPHVQKAIDYIASPGVLEVQRAAHAVHKASPEAAAALRPLVRDHADELGFRQALIHGATRDDLRDIAYQAGRRTPVPAPPAPAVSPASAAGIEVRDLRKQAASLYLGKFAESFVDAYMPSMGAAFDAFSAERDRQEAIEEAENAQRFPALHFTQPVMASYAMGGGMPQVPSGHHHRRHRHHSG